MTRLAILSDIHGNLLALDAVLADLVPYKVDQVIIAGDVVNWGPFSAQVVERVVREGWPVIRGNNELYLLDYGTPRAPAAWHDRSQFPVIPWLQRQLAGRWQAVIAAWPETLYLEFPDAPLLRVYHGIPATPWTGIFPLTTAGEIETYLAEVAESTIVTAHTHIPLDRQEGKWHIVNPGTVGVSVDGNPAASYMLLDGTADGWRARLRRVPFDLRPVLAEYRRQGFVEECGVIGELIVREFETARLHLLPLLNWRAAHFPDEPFTLQLLARFKEQDRRAYLPLPYRLAEDGTLP